MARRQVWGSVAVLAAAGLLGACGSTGSSSPSPGGAGRLAASSGTVTTGTCAGVPTVSATATSQVSVTPDTLTMLLGVSTQSTNAKTALNSNNAKTTKLLGVLKQAGVTSDHLQTTGLSIYPRYAKTGKVTSYQVSNTVSATVTDIASAGATIDAAANTVGNGIQFDNLQFSVADDSSPALSARSQAVKTAEARAQAMASAAGVTLGSLCSISDQGSNDAVYGNSGYLGSAAAAPSGGSGSVPVPVEPGTQQVSATVTVVYDVSGGAGA